MDKLLAIRTFVAVAEAEGFSRAARKLGMATSSVTRLMDALEASLGTILLTRSTRQVSLTDAGSTYLAQVGGILSDLRLADDSVADSSSELTGNLRISVPVTYSRLCLAQPLNRFLAAHPKLTLDLLVSDAYVDLATERVDLAVRIGTPANTPQLIVRRLADNPRILVASPAYLSLMGMPTRPDELSAHHCLRFAYTSGPQRWLFNRQVEHADILVTGRMLANSLDLLYQAAIDGQGIALLPRWMVEQQDGHTLQQVLPDWQISPTLDEICVYLAYLPNRRYSNKVKALVAHLLAQVGHPSS
ncbi:LysR family transcriptional regulator [Chitinimonas naiadis]